MSHILRGMFSSKPSSRLELRERLAKLLTLVGSTPISCYRLGAVELCVKKEYGNPTGSHKDRIAVYMLKGAVEEGLIAPGDCVAEISSGNTATSVAWAASLLGLRTIVFVEKRASRIKKDFIRSFGAEIVEIGDEGLTREWAVEEAERKGCLLLDQMSNEYNMFAHYETTGPEIMRQLGAEIDAFVMGVGTGGTVSGVGKRLKEELGHTLVVAVTPRGSKLSGGEGGDEIEGLTSYYLPPLVRRHLDVIDKIVEVSQADALRGITGLLRATGIAAGPSTGAVYAAVARLMEDGILGRGERVVIVAADALYRYPEVMAGLR